ncbi:MAG TPA: hypothetical protein VHG28_09745, partial [Longimicrobiaceae bacterium]|nr:hypothetical protein [Longimicrobiaceae bacterium]
MRLHPASAFAALLCIAAPALPAQQGQPRSGPDSVFSVEKYLDYETVSDARISPDGSRVVYTRRYVDRMEDEWKSALWIMDADGSRNRFLTRGSSAVWSPDGKRIAYLAEGEPRGTQVWVRWMDGEGGATQVSHLTETPANLRWSPDGRWLGFSMFVPKSTPWRIDLPAAPAGARWTQPPRHVNRLHYRSDR